MRDEMRSEIVKKGIKNAHKSKRFNQKRFKYVNDCSLCGQQYSRYQFNWMYIWLGGFAYISGPFFFGNRTKIKRNKTRKN